MWINTFKIASRRFLRQKLFSVLNISGLSLGMAICIIIALYIKNELSYDRFHAQAERIYRIAEESDESGSSHANIFPLLGPYLADKFPEINRFARFDREPRAFVKANGHQFIEERFFYADSTALEIFSFPLLNGRKETALSEPHSLLITEETALKYFGKDQAVGKVINVNNSHDFKITGVLKNIPPNSHIKFDFLASLSTIEAKDKDYGKIWSSMSAYTYILLAPGTSPETLEKKITRLLNAQFPDKASRWNFFLQPLSSIHLHSRLGYEIESNGDLRYVYMFTAVAIFILLIACVNFMNLATARSSTRAKEVGIKKMLGADRGNLARQFMAESIAVTLAAVPISLILVDFFFDILKPFFGESLSIDYLKNPGFFLGLLLIAVFTGLISGSYPALLLSSFRPASVLYGKFRCGLKTSAFRKVLVVFQFFVSVLLITGTLIIHHQLNFIQNQKLGFSKNNVIIVPLSNTGMKRSFPPFKTRLLQNSQIVSVTASTSLPSLAPGAGAFLPPGRDEKDALLVRHILCDPDFIPAFGLELKEGRNFRLNAPADIKEALVLNETAVKQLGWQHAVGKTLVNRAGKYTVIGVVKDFHFKSKHEKIEPLVLSLIPDNRFIYYASIKISGHNISGTLKFLKKVWASFSPSRPLEYFFLSENFNRLYQSEMRTSRLFGFFTLVTLFIACLGLLGLTVYTAEQRSKEMGIRKVMGASQSHIFYLLSSEFTKWVFLASFIAWPAAYFIMNKWLVNFAYRITISIWVFLFSTLTALLIAFITTSFQSIKTARTNPAEILRFE